MTRNLTFFIALFTTALALGAALAHALELPNKIGLPVDQYFVVQKAYWGWARLGFLLVIELLSMVALTIFYWPEHAVRWPVLAAIACLLITQAIFWSFTFPANVATSNWTVIPDNWQ